MSRKSLLAQGLAEVLTSTRDAYIERPTSLLEALFTSPDYRKRKAATQAASGLIDVAAAILKGGK